MTQEQKTISAAVVIVGFFGLIIFMLLFSFRHTNQTVYNIVLVPKDSTLTIDSKATKPGITYIKNGVRKISASRKYFTTTSKTINTNDLKAESKIYIILQPNSEEGRKWVAAHPEWQQQIEGEAGVKFDEQQTRITKNFPVINKLPHETGYYRIDYSLEYNGTPSYQVTLYIVSSQKFEPDTYTREYEANKTRALNFLQENGVDTNKSTISFEGVRQKDIGFDL
jgi:hypothetical protein